MLSYVLFLVLAALVASAASPSVSASGSRGAVASQVEECSQIGVDIMKKGGNAADSIIAATLCVGTIAAFHSGIGGGGFMIVRKKDGTQSKYEMIDFRETAPAAANKTMFVNATDPNISTIGGLSVSIPSEIRGWERLHADYGSLPWRELFQPSINLARNGFRVNAALAGHLTNPSYKFLTEDPLWSEVYAPNGTILKEGDICFRRRLANTLDRMANEGPDIFYSGEIATSTVAATRRRGGIMTVDDLRNYKVISRTPANATYRGNRIFSTIAPSSGAVVLSALKIFEGYPGFALDTDPAINMTTHFLLQATRFGYGQRMNYGDPAFTANVSTLEKEFLRESVIRDIQRRITSSNLNATYYDISNYLAVPDHGTSHIAAADASGMAISLTTTINLLWGSQIMTQDGFILNDQMADFSTPGQPNPFGFPPTPANFIAPGKRPLSSIASSIVEDGTGEFIMATGSAGGSRIITATLQNLYRRLDQHLTPSQALAKGRWHDQLTNETYFEVAMPNIGVAGVPNTTVEYLAERDYNVTYLKTPNSSGHIIVKHNGIFTAAGDPRALVGGGAAF